MQSKQLVYRLLFDAMLDIRERGHESGDKVVFHLADLFHNTVLQMERATNGDDDFDDVLANLRSRAKQKGCGDWIEQHVESLGAKHLRANSTLEP